jgi:hypothetical protein
LGFSDRTPQGKNRNPVVCQGSSILCEKVKPPRPSGRGFCPAAALRVREACRSSPFDAHEIILKFNTYFDRKKRVLFLNQFVIMKKIYVF